MGQRKRLPDVAVGYARQAEQESGKAQKLAEEASQALSQGDLNKAERLMAKAETASTNARYYAFLAANPDKAP